MLEELTGDAERVRAVDWSEKEPGQEAETLRCSAAQASTTNTVLHLAGSRGRKVAWAFAKGGTRPLCSMVVQYAVTAYRFARQMLTVFHRVWQR